ncbi:MAG: DMT family transporter [Deltaproteobacteria bacterium]|nr:DMT family transporter [Deltaproteobacteria bacterium]
MSGNLNTSHYRSARYGMLAALAAASLFGISAPVSKLLLENIPPLMLAGLLYIGSWAGLVVIVIIRHLLAGGSAPKEARLRGKDFLYLAGSIVSGGFAAPVFLIYGLISTLGSVASLLLNIEGVLTVIIATIVFKEPAGKRIWAAATSMLLAGLILTYAPDISGWSFQWGAVLVALSSLMWAIDNNLTRHLSHRDPYVIAMYKGFVAGIVNFSIAYFILKEPLPDITYATGAIAFGVVGYGASLVFFIYALRNLGASRTSTFFGAAPFIGVIVSIIVLDERVNLQIVSAAILMLAGLWMILKESHEHEHIHQSLSHEHSHIHDEHHDHKHEGEIVEPHCHEHQHGLLVHSHAHVPDLHHYHRH